MRWAIRIVLAYALLFQGFAGAFAGTLHAFSAQAAATTELCTPSGNQPADAPDTHHRLCCVLGCALAQPAPLSGGGDAATLDVPDRTAMVIRHGTAATTGGPSPAALGFEATGPPGSA